MTSLRGWAIGAGLALGLFGGMIAVAGLASAVSAAAPVGNVVIREFRFEPQSLTVAAGATVIWTNRDDDPHTVTSADDPKLLGSPPLDTGETFRFRFDKPGTYRYFCSIHPHMQGTIIVR